MGKFDSDLWAQIQNFVRFFHVFISLLNFALIVTAICGRTWLYSFEEIGLYYDHEYRIGLWQHCFFLYDYGCPTESCTHTGSDVEDFVQVTRSFLIMATIPALLALLFSIAMVFVDKIKGIPAAICHGITFLFVLIAMSVYTAETNDLSSTFEYGWAFIVGWLVFPLILIGFICSLLHIGDTRLPRIIIEYRN